LLLNGQATPKLVLSPFMNQLFNYLSIGRIWGTGIPQKPQGKNPDFGGLMAKIGRQTFKKKKQNKTKKNLVRSMC